MMERNRKPFAGQIVTSLLVAAGLFFGLREVARAGALPLVAQDPEEMYQEYITPETRALLERHKEALRSAEAAEEAARTRRKIALALSLAIGLIPLWRIGRKILGDRSWEGNPWGVARSLSIALLGGVFLFGLNYGIFLLRIKMGDAFNHMLVIALVVAMIAGALYLLRKKGA